MFKIATNPTFTRSVTAFVPIDGGHREETFSATYRVLAVEEVARHDTMTEKGTREFLQKAIVRLDDLADEAGNPLAYSDALRDQVIAIPYVRLVLASEYFKAVSKAKAGN